MELLYAFYLYILKRLCKNDVKIIYLSFSLISWWNDRNEMCM